MIRVIGNITATIRLQHWWKLQCLGQYSDFLVKGYDLIPANVIYSDVSKFSLVRKYRESF